ncbi:hypothetical protein F4677DRAFT_465069 [Hypoxylon crocopeplum]|nr:hypothetical protein F4677DRAFT_465069 [Hypoxylon crocopeplum]
MSDLAGSEVLAVDSYLIHLGIWINWSRGQVMGATLTLRRRDADLLIAFTAFFISFVASRGWRIACFAFHRVYSTSTPSDTIYHQRQAILRNSTSPENGLCMLLWLFWANRHQHRKAARSLPTAAIAAVVVAAFTVAGGFSSRISTAIGDEVLIESENCGSFPPPDGPDHPDVPGVNRYLAETVTNAANYASQCYSDVKTRGFLNCGRLVTDRIGLYIDKNATCPFSTEMCRSKSANTYLDTGYIDSHFHLGINAPPHQRLLLRNVLHCAPLVTEGFTSQKSRYPENSAFTLYHYGNTSIGDYMYAAESLESQYSFALSNDTIVSHRNYRLAAARVLIENKTLFQPWSDVSPINTLSRNDADATFIFLSGNGVLYSAPTDDEWYRSAATETKVIIITVDETFSSTSYYLPEEPASPMGCAIQYQLCNAAFSGTTGCGPLSSLRDSIAGAAPFFNTTYANWQADIAQTETAARFNYFTGVLNRKTADMYYILHHLGPMSLLSQKFLSSGFQLALSANEWQLDVINWWNIQMAAIQAGFVDSAFGPPELALVRGFANYTTPDLQNICSSQKIRSTAYASFSLFGLIFTFTVGCIIILVSYLLEPVSAFLHARKGCKQYQHLEWATNATLQLQRLAHEEAGLGTWSQCTATIPITGGTDEILGCYDITDLEHPVLCSHLKAEGTYDIPHQTESSGGPEGVNVNDDILHPDDHSTLNPDSGIGHESDEEVAVL